MTQPIVIFETVSKSYDGRTPVVSDLNLTLHDGEFLTLLGPSGSGKTTTLMMLAGFEVPDQGVIRLANQDITQTSPQARNLGVVFQNYALFPNMTVARNVAFPLRVRGMAPADTDRKVARALETVGLAAFADRYPKQLSGGQQQRVALARAMVFEPPVILMDEPLGALDRQLRAEMQTEIRRLHRELGVTVLYITHDQDEALALSDRIAIFNRGRIEQIGPPRALFDTPTTRFVAGFLGTNNILSASVVTTGPAFDTLKLESGEQVRASASGIATGASCFLAIRPDKITIAQGGSALANRVAATVTDAVYQGMVWHIDAVHHGQKLRTLLPSDQRPPAIGERISLGWEPQDSHVLSH